MTSLKEWIDIKVKDEDIDYFKCGNFRNKMKIGKGGFGIVYKADYGRIEVALKSFVNDTDDQKVLKEVNHNDSE